MSQLILVQVLVRQNKISLDEGAVYTVRVTPEEASDPVAFAAAVDRYLATLGVARHSYWEVVS